jgi:hypothetical protein
VRRARALIAEPAAQAARTARSPIREIRFPTSQAAFSHGATWRRRHGAGQRPRVLSWAGVRPDDIHLDVASARASRAQLDVVLRLVRDGDTLVITRLDRSRTQACCTSSRSAARQMIDGYVQFSVQFALDRRRSPQTKSLLTQSAATQ